MANAIMIQGTASNAGKSLLAAGLCRIFAQDGYKVAPFKSQNMALNSAITPDGFEMGRAQVVQAEAAGVAPDVRMNPILLKPTSHVGSQVIVNGVPRGTMPAGEYRAVRFVIGEGKGHNWWCVLFPQMCLPVAFEEGLGDLGFTTQELRVLTARPQYEPRFALLEWFYEATGQNDRA